MLIVIKHFYKEETTACIYTIYLYDVTVIYVILNVLLFNAVLLFDIGCQNTAFVSVNQFFTDRSKAVLLLWFIFYIYVSCFSGIFVCSLQPCGHLLVKGWPFGSLLCEVFLWFYHFSLWCPGSGDVLDCIPDFCVLTYFVHHNFLKLR